MSGGQQGGPQMGGSGKGGTQQMPSGGKGGPQVSPLGPAGPQGHMMPNGQRQTRPGGPPAQPGNPFQTGIQTFGPSGSFGGDLTATERPQPNVFPGMPNSGGMPQQPQVSQWHGGRFPQGPGGGLPQSPVGTMPSFAGFNPVGQPQGGISEQWGPQQPMGQPQANFGMPQSPQRQPTPMSGLLAKLYGG